MARVLLLLPTSTYRAADFIEAAQALGAEVIVGSNRQQVLAGTMGARSLALSFDNPRSAARVIVEHAQHSRIDAVVAVDDQGVLTAAIAAEELGLDHNPPRAVELTRDKASMRKALLDSPVKQPEFEITRGELGAVAAAERVGFPCVLKPVSLSASRGVIRADDPAFARDAARRIIAILDESEAACDERILVESYVPGDEVAVEGLLRRGQLEILAIFDKPDPLEGPYFEETIYVTPSRHPEPTQKEIVEAAKEAAEAIGLTDGPIHAEMRLNGSGAWMLEMAARAIGGLCSRTIRFGLGASLEELILRHALGLPITNLGLTWAASGVMMLPIPRAGCLEKVTGRENALAVPGIAGVELTMPTGRAVRPLPEGDRYLGFIFARADSPAEVEAALRSAHSMLEISIN